MTYAPAKFDVTTSHGYEVDAFTRNTLFDLDIGVKVTQSVAQCPLHNVAYAPTDFEVTTSKGLRGDTFTRKYII